MGVYRIGSKWQAKLRSWDGRWWSIVCTRKADAEKHEREMHAAKERGETWVHPRNRQVRLTLRKGGEEFILAQETRLRSRTMERYRRELENFVCWCEDQGLEDVGGLSRPLLRRYYKHLLATGRWGRPRQPQSANKILQCLGVWWEWLYDHDDELGHEDAVPRPRKVEVYAVAAPVTVAPTWSEMDDLIMELESVEWARRAAWLQRFTALRIGETLGVTWGAVNLDTRQIRIDAEISKGGYGGRVLPISTALLEEIERWPRGSADTLVCATSTSTRNSSRPARVYRTAWKRAGVRREAWDGQPTHSVRKGVYSGLLGEGAHPDAVEALAGHSFSASRRPYMDAEIAFKLADVVEMIPRVGERER